MPASKDLHESSEQSFRIAFDTYYEKLCRYAYTIVRDMDEAQDIVQNVFVKIWERKETVVMTVVVKSYLYKAVHNHCMNHLEARAVRQKYQDKEAIDLLSVQQPDVFPQELEENIKAVINTLPQQCRLIFMMSRYQDMKYAEIAAKLGISVNTIENQISKALRILKTHFKDTYTVKQKNQSQP
jgi:RNA polymerase sigma-70 factor (ECF subfamily)